MKHLRDSFTLVELLVVIAIIAILAALLFPVFAQSREKAREATCISNLKQIGIACMEYVQDYDETYPSGWIPGADLALSGTTIWRVTLLPYIQHYGNPNNMYDNSGDWGIYSDPDLPAGHGDNGPTSYGYNAANSGLTTGWNSSLQPDQEYNGKHESQLRRPASVVAFCDAAQIETPETEAADPNWNDGGPPTPCTNYETNNGANESGPCGPFKFNPSVWQAQNPWSSVDWDFGVPGVAGDGDFSDNGVRRPHARHHGKINVVFADGHGKSVPADSYKARLGSPEDIWHDHE